MDDQEVARTRRERDGRFLGSLVTVVLGLLFLGTGIVLMQTRSGEDQTVDAIAIGIGIGFIVKGVVTAWGSRPGDRRWMSEAPQRKRDRLQARRTRQLFLFPFAALLMLVVAFGGADDILAGEGETIDYVWGLLPVLYGWLCAAIVMGWDGQSRKNRRYLEDELTVAIRARAMTVAFFVLMTGATVALVLGLFRPTVGMMALTVALAAAGVTAGVRFAWLDREASKDG